MPVLEKIYKVAAGELKIKITYWNPANEVLDFGIINIGELEYGYEDEDQLTFFPNVFRVEFTDFERKNYLILKKSLERYPDLTHEQTGRVQVVLNGKEIYDGYIEHETLTYDESKRVTSFDAVDFILELKNITTFAMSGPTELIDLPEVLYTIYKQIYPGLSNNAAFNPEIYNGSTYSGIIWDHNWIFRGERRDLPDVYTDWRTNCREPIFAFNHHFWGDHGYAMPTLAELVRQLAKEFGAIIGSTEKNKVFFKKRFGAASSANEFLDSNIISGTLSKTLYLRRIQSVRNDNAFLGATPDSETIQGTFVANPSRPLEPLNKNNNLDIRTYFGSTYFPAITTTSNWKTNVQLKKGPVIYDVGNGIFDPDLHPKIINPRPEKRIQSLTTFYTLKSREKNRDKYEMELNGINYEVYKFYKLNYGGSGVQVLRPMVIKKNLLKNTTSMTALEVGL